MTKRLAIDWDEMEMALTWHFDEGGHFLDLQTGEVIVWAGPEDDVVSADVLDAGLTEKILIRIDPLSSSVRYGWMEEFVDTVRDPGFRRLLERALGGARPFRRFKDTLEEDPAERERWFAFERGRVREAAREWLEENGIEASAADDGIQMRRPT